MRLLLAALLAWPIATLATGLPSLRISGSARAATTSVRRNHLVDCTND